MAENHRYSWLVTAVAGHNSDECLIWPFHKDRDGYGRLRPFHEGARITVGAHRLTFKLKYGRWPEPCALHSCDNPSCVNPRHISEGTNTQNQREKLERGRSLKGTQQVAAKLTEEIVREARKEYIPRKMGFHRLAKKYGVTKHAMMLAITGKSWRHVA
jgi:hypothetical protein